MSSQSDKYSVVRDLEDLFIGIGLNQHQRKVFEVLVHSEADLGAARIAKFSNLKRSHTYQIIDSLIERGLVSSVTTGTVLSFKAQPLDLLVKSLEDRRRSLDEVITSAKSLAIELKNKKRTNDLPAAVRFVRGEDGVKALYNETLKCISKEILAFADFDNLFPQRRNKVLHDWIWRYARERSRHGIIYRGIVNSSKYSDLAWKKRRTEKRDLRMLKDVILPAEINIFDDKVAIISTQENLYGILIQDRLVAATFRALHGALWGQLPVYSPKKS